MKPRLFALLAVAFFLAGNATAESEAPQPTPAAQPAAPAPQPTPAPAAQTPAPIARREDEPDNLSILQRVAAFATSRKRAAENTAGLQSQLDSLRQSLTERDATITGLQATIAKQEGMLQEIGNWLVDNGHSDPSAIAANPAAAFGDAVGNGVAAAVRTIGVPAASVPTAPAPSAGAESKLDEIREQIAACKDPKELGRLAALAHKLRTAN
jgi:hypothetical protein